jgi:hypothetical protein
VKRRLAFLLVVLLCAVGAASMASAQPTVQARALVKVRMPNVVGMRMDRATRLRHSKGLRVNEECDGLLGCILKSRWWICGQAPKPGRLVEKSSVVVIFGVRRGEC